MPTIVELAVPGTVPAVPGWAVRGWADVSRAALVEVLGHDDFADPPAASVAAYADQKHTRKVVLLALRGPAVAAGERLSAWRSAAQTHAGAAYRLVQWVDRTPDRWLTAVAELQRRMSVDIPLAGLDLHQEVWDESRVRDADAARARAGTRYVLSAVEHLPTGSLVAFTQVDLPQDRPTVALQDNTLVHGDHRGRRLGLLVKAANLELLARVQPAVRRLHTWNAAENRHMLAINELMGFRAAGIEGSWQRRLS